MMNAVLLALAALAYPSQSVHANTPKFAITNPIYTCTGIGTSLLYPNDNFVEIKSEVDCLEAAGLLKVNYWGSCDTSDKNCLTKYGPEGCLYDGEHGDVWWNPGTPGDDPNKHYPSVCVLENVSSGGGALADPLLPADANTPKFAITNPIYTCTGVGTSLIYPNANFVEIKSEGDCLEAVGHLEGTPYWNGSCDPDCLTRYGPEGCLWAYDGEVWWNPGTPGDNPNKQYPSVCVLENVSSGGGGKYCIAQYSTYEQEFTIVSSSLKGCSPLSTIVFHIAISFIDPHYTLQSNVHITVQSLCDIVLMDSQQAAGGRGVIIHARHALPESGTYTFISNISLRIGDTIWKLIADGAAMFRDGMLYSTGKVIDEINHLYSVQKHIKGRRGNQVEYVFLFPDDSSISLRANKHFKMAYLETTGFSDVSVTGFLGRPSKKGFFNREGEIIGNTETIEANGTAVDLYAQEWQVKVDEPKLFIEKDVFPQAPNRCVFVDKEAKKDEDRLSSSRRGRKLKETKSVLKAAANAACDHLADSNPKKSWCIDDVMITGEVDIALDTFYD